ncbi:MAG: NifU family protein [Vulcanimicrobiaceae bacterium]
MALAAGHATIGTRVDTLLREIAAAPTVARARERADELARSLVELYGEALERALTIVHDNAGNQSEAIFAALCEDRFVESMLVLHDLHPFTLEDRVRSALDSVRPYLESHAGGIEVVSVVDGVANLRLEGTCDGCPSSAATVKLAVERAILERIHEVVEVRVENVTAPRDAPAATTLRLESEWIALEAVPTLQHEGLVRLTIAATPVVLVAERENIFAYRDRCPSCSHSFDEAIFAHPFLWCSTCGRGYDVAHGGRAEDDETLYAEPLPLVRDGARVRVAVPLGAQ